MLEATNVRLSKDSDEVFDHSFAAGDITVVLGANRSGKTDLCRLIAGLHTHASGRLRLDGENIGKLDPRRRPVSLVYQAFVNYPNLTVQENIASPMRARGIPVGTRKKRAGEFAAMLQIAELMDRMPHELSGGQQQRLAIARALAKEARVLLLDEPLVNLDFKLRETLEHELRGLLKATGTVVVYTGSDPRDAFALGDELLLLKDGCKIQSGAPIDVYRQPGSFDAMELLAEPCINRFTQDGRQCALRPEHISIGGTGKSASAYAFEMTVSAYETNGDESFLHGSVDDHEWVLRCHGMHDIQAGSRIELHARPDDVVSF
jgi:glycerol transport system ATP-binding protein